MRPLLALLAVLIAGLWLACDEENGGTPAAGRIG